MFSLSDWFTFWINFNLPFAFNVDLVITFTTIAIVFTVRSIHIKRHVVSQMHAYKSYIPSTLTRKLHVLDFERSQHSVIIFKAVFHYFR